MKKKVVIEFSLLLSYQDRKRLADFYTILMVVDKRVQASKKEAKNKSKTVQLKARDPTTPKLGYAGHAPADFIVLNLVFSTLSFILRSYIEYFA